MAPERESFRRRDPDAAVLQQVRLSTHRLLGATTRLGDVELLHAAASGLGTRRHVIARLIRHVRRITSPSDDPTQRLASDSLLKAPASEFIDALSTSLAMVVRTLDAQPSAMTADADGGTELCARDHLAWLELTHVDLGVGFEMHDIPEAALPAIAAHLERWTTPDGTATAAGNSPFALLFTSDRERGVR